MQAAKRQPIAPRAEKNCGVISTCSQVTDNTGATAWELLERGGAAEAAEEENNDPLAEFLQITTIWPHSPSCSYFLVSEYEDEHKLEAKRLHSTSGTKQNKAHYLLLHVTKLSLPSIF